ncbi:chemotaxis protein CheW [Shewanella olleyana]|uniref:chemotaxis protein CheW n=1 Tax=Shewanella olleyana TaxID=135626 RepID=UPI00200E88AC|nr:chemotaxis protein CheW [Shewanella olleyana]MCL1066525.1 chemotaxis protein CheW [Shewanella olleyana]
MSKSVDETVFDFFAVLLQEPSTEVPVAAENELDSKKAEVESVSFKKQHGKTINKASLKSTQDVTNVSAKSPQVESKKVHTEVNKEFAEPQVDKAALSKLLSAVSKPSIKQHEHKVDELTAGENPPEPVKTQQQVQQEIKSKAQQVRQQLGQVIVEKESNEKSETLSSVDNKESEFSADISLDKAETSFSETDGEHDSRVAQQSAIPPSITGNLQDVLDDEFQVLFFNVAGLTLAVPLVSLGGIVKIEHINHLIGRPDWFLGVQTRREQKVNVVDSCRWVMPEKYTKELADGIDYQYLVMLEDTDWGLACESLVNAVRIDKSHVNWREKPGKRPWLAGVVKEQMCGILNVQALIEMLDAGLGCQDSID